ncbi:putative transcription factor MYB-HB-like family [Helianthus annuus]|nr:putative transcription factor MYB-HB-like family [Helianthus annuus]KAJ0732392.1 putative transcription factor MYB-HB-like family [Helianthus annuus]KAJ0803572.1 putative transcription factor MYB-HB-like family [Helianthus annuus]KAJ0906017.1 putative transcription factor MYB-HB-like family [Helianthus annuus]KAJ0909282.1 putative transcription factor MYB-HB-like family [Helianthus annuus]
MVSKKRLYYGGLDGFRAPVVPKAPRSLRRNSHKKSSAGSELCPFELLAAVAGKLLQESESSVSSTGPESKEHIITPKESVKHEPIEVKLNPLTLDYLDQGCCGENEFVPKPSNLALKIESPLKDSPQSDSDSGLEHASIVCNGNNGSNGDLSDVKMNTSGGYVQTDTVEKQSEDLTAAKSCVGHRVLNKSYNGVHRNNVKIGIRDDDDENYFSFNHRITKMSAVRLQSRAGYRRMRKILTTTKHWKSVPKLKDYEPSNATSLGVKPFDHNGKNMYMRERCRAEIGSKRRRLFHHNSVKPDYVQETSSESISNLPTAKAVTSSVINHKSSFQSKDGHVKFSIKSFNIPELYIEMPETSTVGSLKMAVMEAATAILEGELHVGVLLQGKKIRDDSITLQQTGISVNSDTLGFMLEPSFPQDAQKEPPLLPPYDYHEPPSSYLASPIMNSSVDHPLATNQESQKMSTEEIVDTKAIVSISPLNAEALSIVPMNHKVNKRSELSQRRTRRPFSVLEVEALVEAVEILGTGRWRDVKIRAFDDADHRTYVDLKDKWKTLVHTASISPQQRRGEPVPQDLLDRVLAAHSMWSKPHGNHQTEPIPVKV